MTQSFQNGRNKALTEIQKLENAWPPKNQNEAEALGYEKGESGSTQKNPLKGELATAWQRGFDRGHQIWYKKFFEEGKKAAQSNQPRSSNPYWNPAKGVWFAGYDSK